MYLCRSMSGDGCKVYTDVCFAIAIVLTFAIYVKFCRTFEEYVWVKIVLNVRFKAKYVCAFSFIYLLAQSRSKQMLLFFQVFLWCPICKWFFPIIIYFWEFRFFNANFIPYLNVFFKKKISMLVAKHKLTEFRLYGYGCAANICLMIFFGIYLYRLKMDSNRNEIRFLQIINWNVRNIVAT